MAKSRVKSILEELRNEQPLYASYLSATKQILENLLTRHGFNAQVILVRIKKEDSLLKNLKTKEKKAKKLADVNDVAGCRVIFYYDHEATRFFNYLEEEFVVSHAKRFTSYDLGKEETGYNAMHAIVHLNDARLQLIEYQKYKGIPCEIQITTAIYHAWQEVTHDILYKDNDEMEKLDPRGYAAIREEFREALHNAVEAQRALDHAIRNVEQIRKNKEYFNTDYLGDISSAPDNNYLHDALETLKNALKSAGDKIPEEIDLATFILQVLTKAKKRPVVDISTTFGAIPGKKYVDILDDALDVLNLYKYKYPRQIALALTQLHNSAHDSEEVKRIQSSVSALVKYDYNTKDNALNYHPQREVLNFILSQRDVANDVDNSLYIFWAGKILHTSYEATELTDYNTLEWHSGGLFVNEFLVKLRRDAISYLLGVYKSSKSIKNKIGVIDALSDAITKPTNTVISKELDALLTANAREIVDFYTSIFNDAPEPVIDKIYADTWWLKQRVDFPETVQRLKESILEHNNYAFYKLCVGYNDHDPGVDWEEADKEREEQLRVVVEQIREGKRGYKQSIIRVARYYPYVQDAGRFYRFGTLLSDIGAKAPDFLESIYRKHQKTFSPFAENILQGLWRGGRKKGVRAMAAGWIKKGENLPMLANFFNYIGEVDVDLAQSIFKKAKQVDDIRAQFYLIQSIAKLYRKNAKLKKLFIDLLLEMKRRKNTEWLKWLRHADMPVFKDLSLKDWRLVIELLIQQDAVDLGVEELLKILIEEKNEKGIELVLDLFHERIARGLVSKEGLQTRYSPVPFELYYISDLFGEYANFVVNGVLDWFGKDRLKNFYVAELVASMFPVFHPVLEQHLIQKVEQGGKNDTDAALSIASRYEGEVFLHNVLRVVIMKNPNDKEVYDEVIHALSSTGVVSGEYGFVNAYEKKKQEIAAWKNVKNKALAAFYKGYISYLNQRIKEETKRADEDIAFRKRDFKY